MKLSEEIEKYLNDEKINLMVKQITQLEKDKEELLNALIEIKKEFVLIDQLCKISNVHEYTHTKNMIEKLIEKHKES